MSDPKKLQEDLRAYHQSLTRHIQHLQDDIQVIEKRWLALRSVYEGDAAESFEASWLGTLAWLKEHVSEVRSIARTVQNRIESLGSVIQTGGD